MKKVLLGVTTLTMALTTACAEVEQEARHVECDGVVIAEHAGRAFTTDGGWIIIFDYPYDISQSASLRYKPKSDETCTITKVKVE